MKILIRNLDRKTTEEELKALFDAYGEVESCDLVMDPVRKESKGFGFVEMVKPENAKYAIKKLNNQTVGSNRIRVKEAE